MSAKEKLIRIQTQRGYQVEDLGKVVIFRVSGYHAMWFFNADGSVDETHPATWSLERS